MTSLLSLFPQRLLRSATVGVPPTPPQRSSASLLLLLPEEILSELVKELSVKDVCSLQQVNKALYKLTETDVVWRKLFKDKWSEIADPKLSEEAAKLAGGFRKLYKDKSKTERAGTPWIKPSEHELNAMCNRIAGLQGQGLASSQLAVVFLLDGSGSVTEADFSTMTKFVTDCAMHLPSNAKASVVQFSNDVRVESPIATVNRDTFPGMMESMARMNGGTNIAIAIQKAGQLLRPLGPETARVLVLLTDGRVEGYQAREAREMAERLADEQSNTAIFAFGVGRGVDKGELLRIICACDSKHDPEGRYMDLCVLDEPPW